MARFLLLAFAAALASCSGDAARDEGMSASYSATDASYGQAKVPPMASGRAIDEQDCTRPMKLTGGNLRCK